MQRQLRQLSEKSHSRSHANPIGDQSDFVAICHVFKRRDLAVHVKDYSSAQVIREVTAAGFRLEAEGNFLRRKMDDHSLPIFDKAIQGHTDQYALKFVKPKR